MFSYSDNSDPSLLEKSTSSQIDDWDFNWDTSSQLSLRKPLDMSSLRRKILFSKSDEETD